MILKYSKNEFGILLALCLPVTIACIDVMAVGVALDKIMIEFSSSLNKTQWLLSGYTIGTATLMITVGKLADIHGRRKLLLWGLFIFGFSSFTSAISNSINLLIISRIAQGLSSAMMMTTVISIITHSFAPDKRAAVISIWGFTCGIGMAIGPLIGGVLINIFNWRVIFLINIPICILSYFLIITFIAESKDEAHKSKINVIENTLLCAILTISLTILSEGGSLGWTSNLIKLFGEIFFTLICFFIYIENKEKNPIIDLSLFKLQNFSIATFCGFASYFCMYAWLFIFSIYLQSTRSFSALETGLACSSFSVAFAISAKLIGKALTYYSNKILIQTGFVLVILSFLSMSTISLNTCLWKFCLMFFILGAGITLINAPTMISATENVPIHKAGIASGIIFTLRWFGGSIGIVVTTLVYQEVSYNKLLSLISNSNTFTYNQKKYFIDLLISDKSIDSFSKSTSLSSMNLASLKNIILQSLNSGLILSCLSLATLAFIGITFATNLKNNL
jgi:EmrB/QacA subfamily drug resistance transporter